MKKPTAKEAIFLTQSNAIEGVFDAPSFHQAVYAWQYLKSQKVLTLGVIKKTHKILMLNQKLAPNEKGYWREVYVQVGDRICPDWYRVPNLMEHWLEITEGVLSEGGTGKRLANAIKKSHVDFERIHPFVDGNGRVGRMILNYYRRRFDLTLLIIYDKSKEAYYDWFRD